VKEVHPHNPENEEVPLHIPVPVVLPLQDIPEALKVEHLDILDLGHQGGYMLDLEEHQGILALVEVPPLLDIPDLEALLQDKLLLGIQTW